MENTVNNKCFLTFKEITKTAFLGVAIGSIITVAALLGDRNIVNGVLNFLSVAVRFSGVALAVCGVAVTAFMKKSKAKTLGVLMLFAGAIMTALEFLVL